LWALVDVLFRAIAEMAISREMLLRRYKPALNPPDTS
jgi:hypothetical protein